MLTICWAAKGGSGTTVVAASMALSSPTPSLLVDLAGDAPLVLGVAPPDTPGIGDWFDTDADTERLHALEVPVTATTSLIHRGAMKRLPAARWRAAVEAWNHDPRHVIIDAGTRPPMSVIESATTSLLVTRACYLSVVAASRLDARPTGLVIVREPGRALREADVESALGAPVVAIVEFDPKVARAVDSGLLLARVPGSFTRELRGAA